MGRRAVLAAALVVPALVLSGMAVVGRVRATAVERWPTGELVAYLRAAGVSPVRGCERVELVREVQRRVARGWTVGWASVVRDELIGVRPVKVVGYIVLLLGYVLLPGVMIGLVHSISRSERARDPAWPPGQVPEWEDEYVYDPLGSQSIFFLSNWLGSGALAASLNEKTTVGEFGKGPFQDADEKANCIICLDDFEVGQRVRKLSCGHLFHRKCCDGWLIWMRKNTCPLCNRPVLPET
mmetsp:Transcript_26472/g.64295  ORF Transcript_26472/g.64295 Transcript_26472/m.64295 type:complete len:239 (+) Transcript_26472:30-746(+)